MGSNREKFNIAIAILKKLLFLKGNNTVILSSFSHAKVCYLWENLLLVMGIWMSIEHNENL